MQHEKKSSKSSSSAKTKILIFVAIIAVVMVVQFILQDLGQGQNIRMHATGHSVTYEFDASPSFHSNDSRFFYFATRDGIRFISSNGVVDWSETLSLNRPIMVTRGDFVAVGEHSGGRRIYVFNSSGFVYHVDFDHPVVMFSINATGFLAAVVQYSTGYGIYVYNQQSPTVYLHRNPIHDSLTIPTAVEISEDGRYIVTAILDLNVRLTSTVIFRYFNERDSLAWDLGTEGLFSSEIFSDQTVKSMRFMENNKLVVVTTSQIACFQIISRDHAVSTQREVWSIDLKNNLSHIAFYGNRYIAYITGDRHPGEADADPVGMVRIRNVNNTEVGYFNLGRRATHLSMGHGAVLVGADRNFHAVNFNGNHIWEHNALHDTRDVLFLDNTDTILIAGLNRAEVHERRRTRNNELENIFD